VTFPYDVLIREQLNKLEGKVVRSIMVGSINTSLFDVTTFDNFSCTLKDGSDINLKSVIADISLNPYTLLVNREFKGDFEINNAKYSSEKVNLGCSINGNIDIELDEKSGYPSNGYLKIMIQNIILRMDDASLPANMGGFPLPQNIKISSINIDAKIKNRTIDINRLLVSGSDLRGRITGSIILSSIFSNSKLNLKISIDPDSDVLKEFKPLLSQFTDAKGKISFPVKGTFSRPRAEMKGIGRSSE